MFHHNSAKNKYGFYQCGDFYTYSKLEAIEKSNATGNVLNWNFNQEVYSQWNWRQAPETDLWTLYTQRAQQIRNQYDYVVLMFSGGADSTNMLDVFLKNNIVVDEICSYHQLAGSKNVDNYMDSEIFKVAYPRTQEVLKSHPTIKHRMLDWSQLVLDILNDPEEINNFVYTQNQFLTPSSICRPHLRKYINDWNEIISTGRKLCLVWGAHKPIISAKSNGKNSFEYVEYYDFMIPVKIQNENNPDYYDELFYHPGDTPIIACKQSHVIKQACIESPESMLVSDNLQNTMSRKQWLQLTYTNIWINHKCCHLNREGFHQAIYPHWNPNTYTDGKPTSWIRNPRDTWLFDSKNTQVVLLEQQIKMAFDRIGRKWWKDYTDYFQGTRKFVNTYEFD